MNEYGMGFDFGNSHATGVIYQNAEEKPALLTLPSVSEAGNLRDYASMQNAAGQARAVLTPYDLLGPDDYVFSYNGGQERFIGRLAQRQTRNASTGMSDIRRYWSQRSLELLLTLAGTLIPDERFSLLVVTGLPVETFRSEEARRNVKQALNGQHVFTLNGRSRVADVKVGKVLMEGAGAALALGIPKTTCGIVDIGEFTTDAYATRGLEAIGYMCKGAEIGMARAGDRLSASFHRQCGRSLKADERTQIFRDSLAPNHPFSYQEYSGPTGVATPEELDTWVVQALRELGREVCEFISTLWRTDSTGVIAGDFAQVQVIGGGAYYLYDQVRDLFPRKARRSSDPENDNGRGYGWFAYQLLKQRALGVA